MALELGKKLTIYSDDPDHYITLEVTEKGLKCTISNDFVTSFVGDTMRVREESVNFILSDKKIATISEFIEDFKEYPDNDLVLEIDLPIKLTKKPKNDLLKKDRKSKNKDEESIPLKLVIKPTLVENMKGLDLEIPNTKMYCDIEFGEDLDSFQSFINDYLNK